jgi:hypothetical protein
MVLPISEVTGGRGGWEREVLAGVVVVWRGAGMYFGLWRQPMVRWAWNGAVPLQSGLWVIGSKWEHRTEAKLWEAVTADLLNSNCST